MARSLAPLDVPADRVIEDFLDRQAMVAAYVRVYWLVLSVVVPLDYSCHADVGVRSRTGSEVLFVFFAGSRMR